MVPVVVVKRASEAARMSEDCVVSLKLNNL